MLHNYRAVMNVTTYKEKASLIREYLRASLLTWNGLVHAIWLFGLCVVFVSFWTIAFHLVQSSWLRYIVFLISLYIVLPTEWIFRTIHHHALHFPAWIVRRVPLPGGIPLGAD